MLLSVALSPLQAAQIDIAGPAGSTAFGYSVTFLPNGNLVVVDRTGPASGTGAVHLYSQAGTLISTLTGGSANDLVGSGGIVVLASGDFLVNSPDWDSPTTAAFNAGAVTWVDGDVGLSGVVSAANSLVGVSNQESTLRRVFPLTNGNYLVTTPSWSDGALSEVGAVTLGSGSGGVSGTISAANSLVGSTLSDKVGLTVTELTNGNFVVCSQAWDNGAIADVGAATWVNGATGLVGAVSTANSLVGTTAQDRVCKGGVFALSNGHYVVRSQEWNNGSATAAGAVTWGNGLSGTVGSVSTANSFVGRSPGEATGRAVVTLTNGNYVVASPFWDNGPLTDVGAVTLLNGDGPVAAFAGPAISLVGSTAQDHVGLPVSSNEPIVALTNGNYLVVSSDWDNGTVDNAGAVTWGNGLTGVTGTISAANSLVGTADGDQVGSASTTALVNGHYVVASSRWNNGAATLAGAATWGNGNGGTVGPVSIGNSLVGTKTNDRVGSNRVVALSNGNYVVPSPLWSSDTMLDVGAVTWGNGNGGVQGAVSAVNSLLGSAADDQLGSNTVLALDNGNYVIPSPMWGAGGMEDIGAVTWVNGSSGMTGTLSAANSLLGTTAGDQLGDSLLGYSDSRYAILSPEWGNGSGAVTLGVGSQPITGNIVASNSVLGGMSVGADHRTIDYDPISRRLAVGQPADNLVSLLTLDVIDPIFANGFE